MNRLTAFSSSPTALMHAFTVEMVQQAMDQWGQAQGEWPSALCPGLCLAMPCGVSPFSLQCVGDLSLTDTALTLLFCNLCWLCMHSVGPIYGLHSLVLRLAF